MLKDKMDEINAVKAKERRTRLDCDRKEKKYEQRIKRIQESFKARKEEIAKLRRENLELLKQGDSQRAQMTRLTAELAEERARAKEFETLLVAGGSSFFPALIKVSK